MSIFSTVAFSFIPIALIGFLAASAGANPSMQPLSGKTGAVIENRLIRYEIANDGRNMHFIDKSTNTDYCDRDAAPYCAKVKKAGQFYNASDVSFKDGKISIGFGESGIHATIGLKNEKNYSVLQVLDIAGNGAEELTFADLNLTVKPVMDEKFTGCAMALNLKTFSYEFPGLNNKLQAICFSKFGMVGAKVALMGCAPAKLRDVMKEVVKKSFELPYSTIGGPWALDAEINRGSYLIDPGGTISEKTVDDWIKVAKSTGATQINFHIGQAIRFGDLEPNPKVYPNGIASLKATIDKLHKSDIKAGLHTYSFFIDKNSRWVTPKPSPELAKQAAFTLADTINADAESVPVVESTADVSTITGFMVRNSVTLQIDDELITFSGAAKEVPFAFTGCKRGAFGTKVAAHAKGARVYQLSELFGLFVPEAGSNLFREVAARTGEVYNNCGFDMIYFDAIDGMSVYGNTWEQQIYTASQFAFDVWKQLKRPALLEASSMWHQLWFIRSRYGAWDAPLRGYKRFVDKHIQTNNENSRWFLPMNVGWWGIFNWTPATPCRTFPDDMEYLCCKALGYDYSLSYILGFTPDSLPKSGNARRLAEIARQYEELRLSRYFPEPVRAKLRVPGDEFTLGKASDGRCQLRPVKYTSHKIEGSEDKSNSWTVDNTFDKQPLKLRVEALMSVEPYDSANGAVVIDPEKPEALTISTSGSNVACSVGTDTMTVKSGVSSLAYTAENSGGSDAWSEAKAVFQSNLDMSSKGVGVWIYGDGQGEILNIEWSSPKYLAVGICEHYIPIDFTGWRYFELVEPEEKHITNYNWMDFSRIEAISLKYTNLPAGKKVCCLLSPAKALPYIKAKLKNISIGLSGKHVNLLVDIEAGSYLEMDQAGDCKVYDAQGEQTSEKKLQSDVPNLNPGTNSLAFSADELPNGVNARCKVTIISTGNPL